MDAAYKSKHLVKKPVAPRRAAPRRKRDDRRSLVQLLVSLGLFLLVFLGRGAFPAQIEAWSEIIETDVNFSAVFQKFGQALAEKEGAVQALKVLGLSLLGGQPEEPPVSSQPPREQAAPVPLGQTGRLGLEAAEEYGIVIRPETAERGGGDARTDPGDRDGNGADLRIRWDKTPFKCEFSVL